MALPTHGTYRTLSHTAYDKMHIQKWSMSEEKDHELSKANDCDYLYDNMSYDSYDGYGMLALDGCKVPVGGDGSERGAGGCASYLSFHHVSSFRSKVPRETRRRRASRVNWMEPWRRPRPHVATVSHRLPPIAPALRSSQPAPLAQLSLWTG